MNDFEDWLIVGIQTLVLVFLSISVSIQLIRIHINITEIEHTCTQFTQLQIQMYVHSANDI